MRPAPTLDSPAATPLLPAFAFTFLSSIGTGIVTSGIYFLTKGTYGFSPVRNYALGVVMGLMYILGAALAGPVISALRDRFPGITTRTILGAITGLMGLACAIPQAAAAAGVGGPGSLAGGWDIWLTVILYNPLSGALWPVVESYISGGRTGTSLRSAVSRWNIVWSTALVLAFWGLAPLIETRGALAVLLLGLIHLASLGLLAGFRPEPGAHEAGAHEPHPESYPRLLTVFRLLLPTAFMVVSALSPYLTTSMARLGVPLPWQPVLATAWLVARVGGFVALERWQRWHGSWAMPVIGGVLLIGGFAMCVLASLGLEADPSPPLHLPRLAIQLSGLALFGIGVSVIYAGAVYYALEVGQAEVDAGGKHESLIGIGYTAGPFLGLLASLGAQHGIIDPASLEWAVLAPVAGAAAFIGLLAFWRVWLGRALHR
jgi:hypothetical protein